MKTIAELEEIRQKTLSKMSLRNDKGDGIRVVVGMATCGIAAGARPVLNAFIEETAKRSLTNVKVTQTGCIGICRLEPIVELYYPNGDKFTYIQMTPEKAVKIINDHIVNNKPCYDYLIGSTEKQ